MQTSMFCIKKYILLFTK